MLKYVQECMRKRELNAKSRLPGPGAVFEPGLIPYQEVTVYSKDRGVKYLITQSIVNNADLHFTSLNGLKVDTCLTPIAH